MFFKIIKIVYQYIFLFFFLGCGSPVEHYFNIKKGKLDLLEFPNAIEQGISLEGEWNVFPGELINYRDYLNSDKYRNHQSYIDLENDRDIDELKNQKVSTLQIKIISLERDDLSLKVNNRIGAYTLSLNGTKILGNGVVSSIAELNEAEKKMKTSKLYLQKGENILILQLSNFQTNQLRMLDITIGKTEKIQNIVIQNLIVEVFSSGVLFILSLYHFGFSIKRKKERYLFYFGVFCFLISLRVLITGDSVLYGLIPKFPVNLALALEVLTFYLSAPFIFLYISELYSHEVNSFLKKIYLILSVFFSLIVVITPIKIYTHTIDFMRLITIIYIFYNAYVIFLAILRNRKSSRTLGLLYLVFIGFVMHELLRNLGYLETSSYINHALLIFSLTQGFLLSRYLAVEIHEIEEIKHNLESLVNDRTRELESSKIKAIRAKEEVETISNITLKILDSSSLEKTLYHIFDYILEKYPFDALALYFVDNQKKIAYPFKVRGKNISDSKYNFLKTFYINLKESRSLFTVALNRSKMTYFPKLRPGWIQHENDRNFIDTFDSKSILYIPVRIEDKAYSMFMGTTNRRRLSLTTDDLNSISRFVSQIAGVVQKVRLLEETNVAKMEAEKQKKETEELNTLIKILNEDQNINIIMGKLYDYIKNKYGITYYGLGILSNSRDMLRFKNIKVSNNLSRSDIEKIEKISIPLSEASNSLHSIAFRKKKTIYFQNVRLSGSPEEIEIIKICKFKNYIIIPLILQGEVIGVLDLSGEESIKLSRDDIIRLSILGEQLAGIVHSSNLVKKIQREKDKVESARIETEILNSLLKRINETNDIYKIAMEIFAYTHVVYQFKNYALFLISQDGKTISLVDSNVLENLKEEERATLSELNIPITENSGGHGYVLAKKKVTYIPSIKQKYALKEEIQLAKILNINSVFVIPLVLHNTIIGFLDFSNQNEKIKLSDSDKTKLSILGEQVAGAIFNSNLLKEVQEEKKKVERAMRALQNAQNQLIESGKMAALGQLVAGVAHELNTPIGAIKATAENMRLSLVQTLEYLPDLIRVLSTEELQLTQELMQTAVNSNEFISTKDERKIKRDIKLYLESNNIDIASEISDTLVEIKIFKIEEKFLQLWKHERRSEILRMVYDLAGLQIKIKNIQGAVDKTSKIVYALKNYSHRENSNEKKEANIIDGIETVITIYQNYIKKGIKVEKNYENIPNIPCYKDELNQIWTNLIHNSIQAMNGEGNIKISVVQKNEYFKLLDKSLDCIEVSIEDNGPGIPQDVLPKIFNPFFTTKKAGEGSGLGLHLCKEIIDKHDGTITVNTEPGKTEFVVRIPIS